MTFRQVGRRIDDLIRESKRRLGLVATAPTSPSPRERFDRWFTAPVDALSKDLDHGDGAFVVMGIGFFLCERYFRSMTGKPDDWWDHSFKNLAADHFDVNRDFFDDFWNIYRNGVQHQGSPKRQTVAKPKPGY